MRIEKQVGRHHYRFDRYMGKDRWISLWHQIDEVAKVNPRNVLELGPGPGIFKAVALKFAMAVETLDLDPDLGPDHVGSATSMSFADSSYDVVCAFQMLEHLPYDLSLQAFTEMARVAKKSVVISLPDAEKVFRWQVWIPGWAAFDRLIKVRGFKPQKHEFDGEHYWEVNKMEYPLGRIVADFGAIARLSRTYRVKENPYHRFFVFEK